MRGKIGHCFCVGWGGGGGYLAKSFRSGWGVTEENAYYRYLRLTGRDMGGLGWVEGGVHSVMIDANEGVGDRGSRGGSCEVIGMVGWASR
eukprot:752807-Hanusia_phi.AAC.7